MSSRSRSPRQVFGVGAVTLLAIWVVACTVAETGSPEPPTTASPSAAPTAATTSEVSRSESPSAGLSAPATFTFVPATETPADPDADLTDSPTPPLPKGTLPALKTAPVAPWTAINWIALPGGHYPAVPGSQDAGNATLVGWHGGYVEFLWDPNARSLTPWVSANGLTWRAGKKMDTSAFDAFFKDLDAPLPEDSADPSESPTVTPDPFEEDSCTFLESQFEEGPNTLLLRGSIECGGGCGPIVSIGNDALWVSSDGLAWTPVDVARAFGGSEPDMISGGSSGFVTLDMARKYLFVSRDGRSWSRGALPPGTNLSEPVALSGGFAMGGAVVLAKGHVVPQEPGCVATGSDQAKYQAHLWWSGDGAGWTSQSAGITGYGVYVEMVRLDDHLLVADETADSSTQETLVLSRDGKSWTRWNGPSLDLRQVLTSRDQAFLMPDCGDAPSADCLQTFDANLHLVKVKQSGDKPWDEADWVIGPTGILASDGGYRFWIGVPSAS